MQTQYKLQCLIYVEVFNLLKFGQKANYLFIRRFPILSVQKQQKLILGITDSEH